MTKATSTLVHRLRLMEFSEGKSLVRGIVTSPELELNYRWELKGDTERAYVELVLGDSYVRWKNLPVFFDPFGVRPLLRAAADEIREDVKRDYPAFAPKFYGYYQKGEKQQHRFRNPL